jgi:hypothetical protein
VPADRGMVHPSTCITDCVTSAAMPRPLPLVVPCSERDTHGMERGGTASVPEIMGRYLAVDEKGTGLRATWRPAQGFTNLSLWRGDVCVETFHLSSEQMGELIAFLGTSLAASCPVQPTLRVVPPHERAVPRNHAVQVVWRRGRDATARLLTAAASLIRPSRRD